MFDYLMSFLDSNGNTSLAGQTNAGQLEKSNGWQPAPQQAHESWAAFEARVNSGT